MKIIFLLALSILVFPVSAKTYSMDDLTVKINQNEYKQMTSVVVLQDTKIVYEHYFNGADKGTQHDMRSASKSLTSLAVGKAIDEGLLKGVDEVVLTHFKDKFPLKNMDDRKSKISIEDLLTMSSSLECDDWNSASRGNEERMYLIEDWSGFILDLPIRGTPPWKKTPKNSPYGRSFSYCTGGVQVLTELVERVSEVPMKTYLQEKLFNEMGIEPPQFTQTPLGFTNGGGGARLTSRDWVKIGELILNHGKSNKKQLISKEWMKQSFKPRAVIDEDRKIEYGYLWWLFEHEVEGQNIISYAASGNGGNYTFITPELNSVTVITSTAYNTNFMHKQSQEIFSQHVLPQLMKQTKNQ